MPCNCGNKQQKQEWLWTSKDGNTSQIYPSEVQARARTIREGGGRITARAKS